LGGEVAFAAGNGGPDVACILVPFFLVTFPSRDDVIEVFRVGGQKENLEESCDNTDVV